MAVQVANFEDFFSKYQERSEQSRLFAFLLCDDRPSLSGIQRFADEHFAWLDQLAEAAQIFFFVFQPAGPPTETVANPSLRVASLFRIGPNRLPGIVLFTVASEDAVNRGIYLPLSAGLLEQNLSVIEDVLSDLFGAIQTSLRDTGTQDELWPILEARVREVSAKEKRRAWVRGLRVLSDLPLKFFESMVSALGEGAAKGLSGQ